MMSSMDASANNIVVFLAAAFLVWLPQPSIAGLHTPPHPLDKFNDKSFIVNINPAITMTLNSTI
jgi:hypothetical protein